jgi:hypothetical protein
MWDGVTQRFGSALRSPRSRLDPCSLIHTSIPSSSLIIQRPPNLLRLLPARGRAFAFVQLSDGESYSSVCSFVHLSIDDWCFVIPEERDNLKGAEIRGEMARDDATYQSSESALGVGTLIGRSDSIHASWVVRTNTWESKLECRGRSRR